MSAKCSRCQGENAFAVKCVEPNGETFECALCMSCVILYRSKGMDCTILEDCKTPEANDHILKKIENFDYVNNVGEVEQRFKKAQKAIEKQKENKQKKASESTEDFQTTEEEIHIDTEKSYKKEIKKRKYSFYADIFNWVAVVVTIGIMISHIVGCAAGFFLIEDSILLLLLGAFVGVITCPFVAIIPYIVMKMIAELCRNVAAIRENTEKDRK